MNRYKEEFNNWLEWYKSDLIFNTIMLTLTIPLYIMALIIVIKGIMFVWSW